MTAAGTVAIVLVITAIAVLGYLVTALLFPDKF